jgi:HD-GYP domain-containing protein (c-di-GMP phosphodiesterase class II)
MGITLFRRDSSTDDSADLSRLDLCADDLRRLVELERGQRALLQSAYGETVAVLARALEFKDSGTGAHSQRVQRYALELADEIAPELLEDRSMEYGFLLHDVGKIGIPDNVLRKPGSLDFDERQLMETHTVLGEQMLGDLALLRGEGLRVVRSHHERWDGYGYPDGLVATEIPLGARIFAVADALDAMTNDRPYRAAGSWRDAAEQIFLGARLQFDPDVVEAFRARELALRRLHREIDAAEPALIAH